MRFIRTAQAAGLTLVEIGSITALRDDGHIPGGHVAALLNRKLDTVRARRRELADVETELEQLLSRSTRLDPADCDADAGAARHHATDPEGNGHTRICPLLRL